MAQIEIRKFRRAKQLVEEIVRKVIERKRRLEVVRGALKGKIGARNSLKGSKDIPRATSLIVNLNLVVPSGAREPRETEESIARHLSSLS